MQGAVGALGEYRSLRPQALANEVALLWAFRGPTRDTGKRVLPNGRVELLLNYGEAYHLVLPDGPQSLSGAFVGGLGAGPQRLWQPPYQDVLGVRLEPLGAYRLLGPALAELTGRSVPLTDLLGAEARRLLEQTAPLPLETRLRRLAGWLHARLRQREPAPAELAWVIGQLDARHGDVRIGELQRATGWSKQRLLRMFARHVGLTPKVYARVLRFRRVTGWLQQAPASAALSRLAQDAAFFDHAHMDGEFRRLAGLTPTQFLSARHPVGDGATVADRGELFSKTPPGPAG